MDENRRGKSRGRISRIRQADADHQVVTVVTPTSDRLRHRRRPCEECPWRKDAPRGAFPAEAYRHSADTAHDVSQSQFSCHMSGAEKVSTCAGFLLRGADHNLAIRMAMREGRFNPSDVTDGGIELYAGYRSMAIANGVDPADATIAGCRGADEIPHRRERDS